MLNLSSKITNPEAIKFLNDLQSGALWLPLKAKIIRYQWYWVSGLILIFLVLALFVGKSLFRGYQAPVFLPPDISTPRPSTEESFTSGYETIRQRILNFSPDLPDPVIPPFDNIINLESDNI